MSTPSLLIVPLSDADRLAQKLLAMGDSLKPIDDENYHFFQIVRELVDAAIKNFNELRRGYVSGNLNLVAWASRNLLELTVFTRYVLKSGANARRFGDDRLIDGCELIIALSDLEHYYDSSATTPWLDEALKRMEDQKAAENVTAMRHLETNAIAREVGMEQEFRSMNRVSSKLVHPTAWSTLAENSGTSSYPEGTPICHRNRIYQSGLHGSQGLQQSARHGAASLRLDQHSKYSQRALYLRRAC
jgi:hypothetical protein